MKKLIIGFAFSVFASITSFAHEVTEEESDITFVSSRAANDRSLACSKIAEAQPCVLSLQADSSNCAVRFTEIVASYTVTFGRFGRNDSATKTHVWRGDACKLNLSHTISDDVRAGNVSIRIAYRMTNGQNGISNKSVQTVGANPSSSVVRADIRNPIYSAYIYRVSGFKQFTSNGQPSSNSAFGGFGVGDVIVSDSPHLWNWKTNLTTRIGILDAAWKNASKHPSKMRAAGFSVPDFNSDQLARQALLSLRGRSYYQPAAGGGWEVAVGNSNFAERVMQIAADVAAGNPPSDW